MKLPIIDFSSFDHNRPQSLVDLGVEIESALTNVGFMAVSNIDVTPSQLKEILELSQSFFSQTSEVKNKFLYLSAEENFGYQSTGVEYLDPTQASDIKETFTMRDIPSHAVDDERWPSNSFQEKMIAFHLNCMSSAIKIQQVFSTILDVPLDFFVEKHTGENVSIRLLHYPPTTIESVQEGQLGAGAHTDYGMLTLLFQDDIGGLQVLDKETWVDVDPQEGAIIVNTGDLMERWTNGRFKSTLHRVQPRIGSKSRSSIAVFVDPDSATQVETLESCVTETNPSQYEPISAGEHIQEKIKASHLKT